MNNLFKPIFTSDPIYQQHAVSHHSAVHIQCDNNKRAFGFTRTDLQKTLSQSWNNNQRKIVPYLLPPSAVGHELVSEDHKTPNKQKPAPCQTMG